MRRSFSTNRSAHWQRVYQSKADQETSWFQEEPTVSLELIRAYAPRTARVIDVGGGSSLLGTRLVENAFKVTVLDVSQAAVDRAKIRVGAAADCIRWLVDDITHVQRLGEFDIWHDRAAFHFLTAEDDRRKYAALAAQTVVPGGYAIIGTFATDGPEQCSGLDVERYDEEKIARVFDETFTVVHTDHEVHMTPWGKPQAFFYAVLQRTESRQSSLDPARHRLATLE